MKTNIKKALQFTVILLPVAIMASYFVAIYAFNNHAVEIQEQILEQMGSYQLFLLLSTIQGAILASVCAFFGYILAEKTGLLRTFRFEREKSVKTLIITLVGGIIFSLDYWIFGAFIPEIREMASEGLTFVAFTAAVLYGGIIEEILFRWFFISLLVFIFWKLFFKKMAKEQIPVGIFIVANALSAFLFAAGHLPATIGFFGELTPMLVFRCFLLNGAFGYCFGWLYHKYGIQYAMTAHAGFHIVSKVIWLIFI